MADELTAFLWAVPARGYSWEKLRLAPNLLNQKVPAKRLAGPNGEIEVLTEGVPLQAQTEWRSYRPLIDNDGLFKEFALQTPPTHEGILAFANKYGALGGSAEVRVLLPTGAAAAVVGTGEPAQVWEAEIIEMRRLVTLWESAKSKDSKKLADHIKWTIDGAVLYEDQRTKALIANGQMNSDRLAYFRRGDLTAPALWHIQERLNLKLIEHSVSVRLLWDSRTHTSLSVHMVPTSLISCLWLQFGKAVAGNRDYRQCGNCEKWFEVGGSTGARSDKKFCTPTCKAAAHRRQVMK